MNYDADEDEITSYDKHAKIGTSKADVPEQKDLKNLMKGPMTPYFHKNVTPEDRFQKLRKMLTGK